MRRRHPDPVISRLTATIFGLVIAVAAALLVVPLVPGSANVEVGDRASSSFVATRDAQFESEALTAAARQAAADSVAPVSSPADPTVRDTQLLAIGDLLDEIAVLREDDDLSREEQLAELQAREDTTSISTAALSRLLIITTADLSDITGFAVSGTGSILEAPLLEGSVDAAIQAFIETTDLGANTEDAEALQELLEAFVVPNATVDEDATGELRSQARNNVAPFIVTYASGQVVANDGQVLDQATIEALRATGIFDDEFDYSDLGAGLLAATGLGILLAVYLYLFQPLLAPVRRPLALSAVAIIATLVALRFAMPSLLPDDEAHFLVYALPVGTAAMVTASFLDLRYASVVAFGVGAFAAFMAATTPDIPGADFTNAVEPLQLTAAFTAAGLAGAAGVHRADRLGRYAVGAVAVAFAVALVLGTFWLLDDGRESESVAWIGLAAGISGLGSASLAITAYVLLSLPLGVTTRLQLMELAQSGHPLLKRLQDEAPGTYHHSMMVGALAERAAEDIGADSLLTRAGAYYHDIGKLAQPIYYIENQLDRGASPHDDLDPIESARRIHEHVTNGVEIARKNRIPKIVRDFIPQHHGDRLVAFFYRQAVNDGLQVTPEQFRYAGPRPQTKESAIVMLSDSCEALVRARQARTGEEMDELVDGVIAERLAEGQFDECDITMRDLQSVASSFKSTLRAVYHPRIEYPDPVAEELAEKGEAAEATPSSGA